MGLIKALTRAACRIDAAPLARVPAHGPLIVACNHVNFLEVPVIYTHLLPRSMTGLTKAESFNTPLAFFFHLTRAIPVRRGEGDTAAFRQALAALKAGDLLAVAPEGTRSGDGRLQAAHAGVAVLALHSGAPILPLAYWGHEAFWRNARRLRRTDFRIGVGEPWRVELGDERATAERRQTIADEIMGRVAALMPPAYRGVYAAEAERPPRYLRPATAAAPSLV